MIKTIAYTGGGTGGHVYPGLAVREEFKKRFPDVREYWIGSGKSIERSILEKTDIPFFAIPSGKLRRYFSFLNFIDIFRILAAFLAAFFIFLRRRPDFLFSKGGYVSVPPVIVASILKIPVYTHESDFDPGLATKINSRFAHGVFLPYQESTMYFPEKLKPLLHVTGNPVREAILSAKADEVYSKMELDKKKPLLVVLGGSLGALQINKLIADIVFELPENVQVVHQTGENTNSEIASIKRQGYHRFSYIHEELPSLLAAADLVISRAGAGTLWELASLGVPALLVPLGTAGSRGDQIRNCEYFVSKGAAVGLLPGEANAENLLKIILELLPKSARRNKKSMELKENIREIAQINAVDMILSIILKELEVPGGN